jgi:hypothetical protein
MPINPMIPLAGNVANPMQSYAKGLNAAQAENQIRKQNALDRLLQQSGAQIAQGDPNALGKLAQFDPTAAIGIEKTRADMKMQQERLQMARASAARAARAEAARMTAAEREAEAAKMKEYALFLSGVTDEETLQAFAGAHEDLVAELAKNGIPLTLDNIPGILTMFAGAQDGLKLREARQPEPPPEQYRQLTPEEVKSIPGLDPSKAYQVDPKGKITVIGGSSQVTVNTGDQGPRTGPIPSGYAFVEDPNSPAGGRMEIVPGGPADTKAKEAEAKTAAGEEVTRRGAQNVYEDTSRAINMIKKHPNLATGTVAFATRGIPGMPAFDVQKMVDSIRANIGIDALLKIKASGAGLGQVPQRQLEMLANTLGNLDTVQDPKIVLFNLNRVRDIYKDIVKANGGDPAVEYADKIREYGQGMTPPPQGPATPTPPTGIQGEVATDQGPGAEMPPTFGESPDAKATADEMGISIEELWQKMDPETRALWAN